MYVCFYAQNLQKQTAYIRMYIVCYYLLLSPYISYYYTIIIHIFIYIYTYINIRCVCIYDGIKYTIIVYIYHHYIIIILIILRIFLSLLLFSSIIMCIELNISITTSVTMYHIQYIYHIIIHIYHICVYTI